MVAAHKVAWILDGHDIPRGMKILHRCDNPICVRPQHLFVGTQAENIKDMMNKGRAWWQTNKPIGVIK
jgi:HNH endonuclease